MKYEYPAITAIMSKIIQYLVEFSDRELAFFYQYRLPQYIDTTQETIKDYIFQQRHLTLERINQLLSEKLDIYGSCIRCGSAKSFSYDVDVVPPYQRRFGEKDAYSTEMIKKEQTECFVYGYKITKVNPPSILDLFRNLFSKK